MSTLRETDLSVYGLGVLPLRGVGKAIDVPLTTELAALPFKCFFNRFFSDKPQEIRISKLSNPHKALW